MQIKADDVKVGHAATIGQIDEDAIFYLMSRGLSKEEAKNILIEGFFEDIFSKIPDQKIRQNLKNKIPRT